jgi:NAD-dependent SIR2 family protein deacetylase
MPRRKESDSQTGLPFSRFPSRERTLEIHCDNCQARLVAWYASEEEAETETVDVEKCELCAGDSFKKHVLRYRDPADRAGDRAERKARLSRGLGL